MNVSPVTVIFGTMLYGLLKFICIDLVHACRIAVPPISRSSNVTRPWNVTVDWNMTDFINVAISANVVLTCIKSELIVPMIASRTD